MVHMQDAMRRHLQRFFEYDLMGLVPWNTVRLRYHAGGEGDVVEADFALGPRVYGIRVQSPDADPMAAPHGGVWLNDKPIGPLDTTTWQMIAQKLKGDLDGNGQGAQRVEDKAEPHPGAHRSPVV